MNTETGSLVERRTRAVKARAQALGFDACGVAQAGEIEPEDRLGAWLAQGHNADMGWLACTKELRQDPRALLPGARSVVVVASNYYAARPATERPGGRVSRYAWGRDYHRVLRKPLRDLTDFVIGLEDGAQAHQSIDTGPIAECAWASRAGVGWIGKNALLIRQDAGSWVFLGVILTTVALVPDTPAANRCGTCRRCIDACPTGAIIAPGVVDARRCIAYHTIENRKAIPEDLQPLFGDWVFGCDVCQEVCPWNSNARETSFRDFHPRPGHASLDLEGLDAIDETTFKKRFAGSPIRRATLSGMQRNACIVARNLEASAP